MGYTQGMMDIARERERLIAECAAQRADLAVGMARWRAPLAAADRVVAAARYARANPLWPMAVVAAAAGLYVFRARGIVQLLKRGFTLWRAWRALQGAAAARGESGGLLARYWPR